MAVARVIVFIMPVDFIAGQLCEDLHARCDSHSALHNMRSVQELASVLTYHDRRHDSKWDEPGDRFSIGREAMSQSKGKDMERY